MIMIVINFAIQFGYYGLWLWFPELFNKLEIFHKAFPNNTINVCEVGIGSGGYGGGAHPTPLSPPVRIRQRKGKGGEAASAPKQNTNKL